MIAATNLKGIGYWGSTILRAAALLAPRFPRLKEWAYAGAFFNFSGAVVSHVVAGSAAFHVVVTGLLTIVTIVSWLLRPADRTLGRLTAPAIG